MAAAGVSLAMLPRHQPAPASSIQRLSAPPAGVAVIDGGTLRLGERVVRLQGLQPPERGMACGGEDCGAAATNAVAALVRDMPVSCRITGDDGPGHADAVCEVNGTELNATIVAAGWAHAAKAHPALQQAEATARAEKRGLWARAPDW